MHSKILRDAYQLKLPKIDIDRLNSIIEFVKNYKFKYECEVYLFGSFAKGKIKDSSDIDLLVVMNTEDKRAIRKEKLTFIDKLEDSVGLYYGDDFDLLTYSKSTFTKALEKSNSFESMINSYMMLIDRS